MEWKSESVERMSGVVFKLNKAGVKEILQSEETLKMCEDFANSKKSSDEHIKSFVGFDRAKAIIYPDTKEHKK